MMSFSAMDWIGITPYPIALLITILVGAQIYFAKRRYPY